MAELEHLGGKRAESARARRAEQLRRWRGSLTEQEPTDRPGAGRQPQSRRAGPRVRFEDGAVFLAACSSGDTDEVRRLLARGADVDTANVDGLTALHQVSAARVLRARFSPPPLGGRLFPTSQDRRPPQSGVCISLPLPGSSWLPVLWPGVCCALESCFLCESFCRL